MLFSHDDPYEFDLHWRLGSWMYGFSNEPNCILLPKSCRKKSSFGCIPFG